MSQPETQLPLPMTAVESAADVHQCAGCGRVSAFTVEYSGRRYCWAPCFLDAVDAAQTADADNYADRWSAQER